MKRFSEVSQDKKIQYIENQPIGLQLDIKNIIETSLNISIEGDLDDYLTKNIGIDGKDKLIEKLSIYIEELTTKNISNILEKVRYQGLDNVILEHQTPGDLKKHKERIESLLNNEDPIKIANRQATSIKNGEKAYYRGIAAEQMVLDFPEKKKILKEIMSIFSFRAKQLGFRKYG